MIASSNVTFVKFFLDHGHNFICHCQLRSSQRIKLGQNKDVRGYPSEDRTVQVLIPAPKVSLRIFLSFSVVKLKCGGPMANSMDSGESPHTVLSTN